MGVGKASFPQTGAILRQARRGYRKQSSKGLSRDDPGRVGSEGLPQCQGMQVTLVWSPLHSHNLLSRTIPRKAPGATILLYNTLWPSRRCPGVPPDTCPAQPPPDVSKHTEMGVADRAGEQKESKNPLKALLPMAISCLFPTLRDHKCFLSEATLLQPALLCRGKGCQGTGMERLTPWRGLGDSGGHCQAAPAPAPSSAGTPDPPTYADICGHLCSGRCQHPASQHLPPLPDPAPDTRHKSTKNPSLGRRGPARMVKDQLKPCL